jgi:LPS-assembly protein
MPSARVFHILLVVGCLLSARAAVDVDLPATIPDEPFDIQAARLEYTNDTVIASGGVTGRFENVMIRADQLSGRPDTGDLKIEGDILFERDNVIWTGSSLEYNYLTQTGNFGPSALDFEPVLLSVDHVERVSTNEYMLQGATFTTCPEDYPHFHVRAKEARLVDEKYLIAKGVVVYVGNVPVFYWPYWRQELSEGIFTFKFGHSSEWGGFGLINAKVPVRKNIDWISDINLYSHRGVGLGQELVWNNPNAKGRVSGFYLYDLDPNSRFDSAIINDQIGDDRTRFTLEHLQNFTDTLYLNTKWTHLSDLVILEEFYKSEFKRNVQPENYGSVVYGNSFAGTEVLASSRLNDFYDNVDRYEYSGDLYRTRVGKSPFYFQSENTVSGLRRVFTNTTDSAYDTVRIDSANVLSLPQRIGFLNVVPRASYRATYYSHTAATNGGGDELRNIPGAGMEVSFQATKVLSEQARWYGRGLRHKIEPYADYIYEDTSLTADRVLQFDAVDALSDENKVKLGLRNILQTKREGRVSRFVDLDLYTHYLVDQNSAPHEFDSLYLDARMPITKRTMVDLEGRYDWYDAMVPNFNTRISHDRDDVVFSFEHLYQESERSLWTSRVDLFPESDVSFEAYGRYDDRSNELEEIALFSYFNWCCMRYGLGYRFYDDSEYSIMLSIGLSAFPEARLGF